MTSEQIDARLQTVRSMIASYTLTLRGLETESRYIKRKLAEYQHEESILAAKKGQPQ